ncbi:MAG TPA: hypothetical protein VJL61_03320 [Rhodanobacteraceae bacterium]|nr:hypothetical protein [Rhodanobacteraceae bacterium]
MDNEQTKELCLELLHAETEQEIIDTLRKYHLWDDASCWRYYGDTELNWSQAGGQQGRADFALNEKVINSIDAVLTRECLLANISPESPEAPQSIREAVAKFIEHADKVTAAVGRIEDWTRSFRTQVAENISVFATEPAGSKSGVKPSVNVADLGEGHTPEAFPVTLVSLGKKNKASVQFVQGKFCQGGSGAIRHCGEHKLQLIISKRNPALVASHHLLPTYPRDDSDDCWGFTVVRREAATAANKLPMLTYLAPLGATDSPRRGGVLRFRSDYLPIFPKGDRAYERPVQWGTLIKLFAYQLRNTGNILRRDGLLYKLDLLLPDPALPVRMHECRPGRQGKGASEQTTTMSGLFSRLSDPKNENVENAPPTEMLITVRGKQLVARVFAFKAGKGDTYRRNEGVILTVNGQAHAEIKDTIFARKAVGLARLQKDLLVVVDCSTLDANERDDLFMSSRDRVAEESPLFLELESSLMEVLADHPGLRELRNRRAQEDLEEKLGNDKPLEQVLQKVLKNSPALAKLFGRGARLSNPFKPQNVRPAPNPPQLRLHPTFFHFAGKVAGAPLQRMAHMGQKCRVIFTTDAADDYFTRKYDKGKFVFNRTRDGQIEPMSTFNGPNLVQGRATISFDLSKEATVGDLIEYVITVEDNVTQQQFVSWLQLQVAAAQPKKPNAPSNPHKPPGTPPGGSKDTGGLALPKCFHFERSEPKWAEHFTDIHDCLDLIAEPDEENQDEMKYTFYMNDDNIALLTELKATKLNPKLVKKQFEIGAVLVGLALIYDKHHKGDEDEQEEDSGDKESGTDLRSQVKNMTRALAPVLLPMIQALGELTDENLEFGEPEVDSAANEEVTEITAAL